MNPNLFIHESRGGAALASGVLTTIHGPVNLIGYRSKGVTVHNQGIFTLSGVQLQINPEPGVVSASDPRWETIDSSQNLAAGGVKTFQSVSIAKWWRIAGLNTACPTMTASGYCHGTTY